MRHIVKYFAKNENSPKRKTAIRTNRNVVNLTQQDLISHYILLLLYCLEHNHLEQPEEKKRQRSVKPQSIECEARNQQQQYYYYMYDIYGILESSIIVMFGFRRLDSKLSCSLQQPHYKKYIHSAPVAFFLIKTIIQTESTTFISNSLWTF